MKRHALFFNCCNMLTHRILHHPYVTRFITQFPSSTDIQAGSLVCCFLTTIGPFQCLFTILNKVVSDILFWCRSELSCQTKGETAPGIETKIPKWGSCEKTLPSDSCSIDVVFCCCCFKVQCIVCSELFFCTVIKSYHSLHVSSN